jgi:glycosidase
MLWRPGAHQKKRFQEMKTLLALRQAHPALVHGHIKFLFTSNAQRALIFERATTGDRVLVGLNWGPEPVQWSETIANGHFESGAPGNKSAQGHCGDSITIPPLSATLYNPEKKQQEFFPSP